MNSALIRMRSLARRTGIVRLIHRLRPSKAYEERFHQSLVQAVRPGDTVWDVGANVGLYTEQFCQWVGETGHVIAFEPGFESFERLRDRLKDCRWLTAENIALGESDMAGRLVLAEGSVENHIATDADLLEPGTASIPVTICRGDSVCKRLGRIPNVVKIDVEGFEEEVLVGMATTLSSPALRSVLVEVHFLKLELRGQQTAPVRIERLLRGKGFRTQWVDASHLVGTR